MRTDSGLIPGGCPKFIKPANVSWNKCFRTKYMEKYDECISKGKYHYTASEQTCACPLKNIFTGIHEAWANVSENLT